jgi:hypothetical protein
MVHKLVEVCAVLPCHLRTHILQPGILNFPRIISAFDVELLLHPQ